MMDSLIVVYLLTIVVGLYFFVLSVLWMTRKRARVDPFFTYVLLLVAGIVASKYPLFVARRLFLTGFPDERDAYISSFLFMARDYICLIILLAMCIHATYRYFKK